MNDLATTLGGDRDNDGVIHFNRNARGCPHCGAVEAKPSYDSDGNLRSVLYHAGAECCDKRLAQQVAWRQAEYADVEARLQEAWARPDKLRADSERASSRSEAQRLASESEKARANMPMVERAYQERLKGLASEIKHASRKRQELAREAVA